MANNFDPYHEWLGVPPEEQPPNHYRLLELSLFEDLSSVIRAAAAKRTEHLRTYQLSKHSAECQQLLNEVAAASACLLNVDKKAAYDTELRDQLRAQGVLPQVPSAGAAVEQPAMRPAVGATPRRTLPPLPPRGRSGKRARALPDWLPKVGLAACVVAFGLALVVAVFVWGTGSYEKSALVFEWPEDQRSEATLKINGKSEDVPAEGPVVHHGVPGNYEIVAARPGFEPFETTVDAGLGETTIRPVWQAEAVAKAPAPADEEAEGEAESSAGKLAEAPAPAPKPKPGAVDEPPPAGPAGPGTEPPPAPKPASRGTLAEAIARARESVVRVLPIVSGRAPQAGAGFVVGPRSGLVVASYRTIAGASRVRVLFSNGNSVDVTRYAATDESRDIALLRVASPRSIPGLRLANSSPEPGEDVAAVSLTNRLPGVPSDSLGNASGGGGVSRGGGGFGGGGFGFGGLPSGVPAPDGLGKTVAVLRGEQLGRWVDQHPATGPEAWTGFDPAATWIRATATISQEDGGGPLVDVRGEVVGMSVWIGLDVPGLGVALAADEVRRLILTAGDDSHALASLEQPAKEPAEPRDVSIALASGRVFRPSVFRGDRSAAESLIRSNPSEGGSLLVAQHESLFSIAYLRHRSGDLDGLSAAFYEDDTPKLCATYEDNALDGLLQVWDPEGRDLYWCEYAEGERTGICCLFKGDDPWMVAEFAKGKIASIVLLSEGKEVARFDDRANALANEAAGAALRAAEAIEADVGKCDARFRREALDVKLAARKEANDREKASRRSAASKKSSQARHNISARIKGRSAARNAAMGAQRRASGVSP